MKIKVHVTGTVRTINSANGKTHHFSEVWAHLPNQPYPVQVDVYGQIKLPAGEYEVPLIVESRDRRLGASLNFNQATPVKQGA